MTDGELLCNFKKCRKVLTDTAYITRCSHAFCEEDGIKQIESQHFEKKCPACQSPLVKNYDLVKVTLNPNDQFKSMVLAGLRPEVVMDIATRAIMFWSYQQHQEQLHHSLVSKSLKDVINQMKTESDVETGFLKSEIQGLKRKLEDLEKELDNQNVKCSELCEKLALKTREVQKWQIMSESLKRRQLSDMAMHCDSSSYENNPTAVNVGPQTMNDFIPSRSKILPSEYQRPGNNYRDEVLNRQIKSPRGVGRREGFVFQPREINPLMSPKVYLETSGNYGKQQQRKY